jgi:exodeoxyribonuclease-3
MSFRIVSWNVNGYRAAWKKGFADWLRKDDADVIAIQETKAWPEQLTDDQLHPLGYFGVFAQAEKKGYSGVATFSREVPNKSQVGFGDPEWDTEGRVVVTEHLDGRLLLANIYFPNGKRDKARLQYKLDFYEKTQEYFLNQVKAGKHVIVCGDVNTAHREIDLARPKENETTSGFLPEERAWIDRFLDAGFIDTFRTLYPDAADRYSWWDMITRARERNVGWRIDYHFASASLANALEGADIHDDVMGSDHCPVSVTFNTAML